MINHNTREASDGEKPGILRLLSCKCPRCRRGDMFKIKNPYILRSTMKMHNNCPVCGQPFNIEVGFYYGSSYMSYVIAIALSAASLGAWWLIVGLSLDDNRFLHWIVFNSTFLIVAQPYLMRLARTTWLAFFVYYDRNWEKPPTQNMERVNEFQEDNW